MFSESIRMFPAAENAVVLSTVIVVTELFIAPLSWFTAVPKTIPPQVPAPQPTFREKTSTPVVIWYAPITDAPPLPESPAAALTEAVMVYEFELM